MIKITQEMWDAWSNTNNALTHRSSELFEAKNKLQQHLQMVKIFNVFNKYLTYQNINLIYLFYRFNKKSSMLKKV